MKKRWKWISFFDYLIMLLGVFVSIAPLIWIFISSFKTNKQILSSAFSLPTSRLK